MSFGEACRFGLGLARSGRGRLCLAVAVAVSAFGVAASGLVALARSRAAILTPVTQRVFSTPRWYYADDNRFHLEYELELINGLPRAVNVTSLQVRSAAGRGVETLSGKRLKAAMSLLATPDERTTKLPPSTVGVVWLDLSFARRRQIPRRIEHRLTVDVGQGLPIGPIVTRTGGKVRVSSKPPVEIGPPLRGGPWVAVVGAHRRSLLPVNGAFHNGQRFAIDWAALLDAKDRTHAGSPSRNRSYFNYGQPVLAVGAGKVVQAVDRYPDQVPGHKVPVPPAAAEGNHVILRLGNGVFAAYAHLVRGSVRVHRGEFVREGQVLGRLGNSGNSSGPHLHFQLMTRPSLLDSDGLPFVLDRFRLDGRVPSLQALIAAEAAPPPVPPVPIDRSVHGSFRDRGLTDLDLVTLPDR